jgi:hypothetical protein
MLSACLALAVIKSVQCAALTFESVHNVHGSDSLAARVLGICHRITNYVLEKDLQYMSSLLVNQCTDALDSSSASKAANCGLGNALDVVSKDSAMALSSAFSQTNSTFTATRHDDDITFDDITFVSAKNDT